MESKMMSNSACHTSLPSKMEAFGARLYIRVVNQYEKLLKNHFNKSPKGCRDDGTQVKHEASTSTSTKSSSKKELINTNNDVTPSTYSAVNAFRRWRKTQREADCSVVPMNNADTGPSIIEENDVNSLDNLEQFPSVLSNTTTSKEDLSLRFLAMNTLNLIAPASDVNSKNRLKSWFQLAGHPDDFAPAGPGTIWKRVGGCENTERIVYEELSQDKLINDYIPKYYREVKYKSDAFIELQDLLFGFNDPHVIDIKLGTRTFLESEVSKTNARSDLYKKMVAIDQNAPTTYEHECKAVTKLRYMQFREEQSSTRSLGFRIEAVKFPGKPPKSNLKKIKDHDEVVETIKSFFGNRKNIYVKVLERLKEMKTRFELSFYFQTHEVIGSSIFMIYDNDKVGVWLIDFAKTHRVPDGKRLTHREPWIQGNHEEGFLLGLDNLISIIEQSQTTC